MKEGINRVAKYYRSTRRGGGEVGRATVNVEAGEGGGVGGGLAGGKEGSKQLDRLGCRYRPLPYIYSLRRWKSQAVHILPSLSL